MTNESGISKLIQRSIVPTSEMHTVGQPQKGENTAKTQSVIERDKVSFTKKDLQEAAKQIENFLRENVRGNLRVGMDETLNRPVVKVFDADNNLEFSIPNDAAIRVAQSVEQMQGYFFDGKV